MNQRRADHSPRGLSMGARCSIQRPCVCSITASEIWRLRGQLRWTQARFAAVLGVQRTTRLMSER